MSNNEAADQVVNMSLKGIEMAAKISGLGAKNIAVYLYAVLNDQKKTKGKARLSGMLKPDYVIPFKLDKKAAKAAYMRHIEGKRLLPKLFRDQNHIDEIKGIYVPFWLFDADADRQCRLHQRAWTEVEDLRDRVQLGPGQHAHHIACISAGIHL